MVLLRQSALFPCTAVFWKNSVPTSLPPDLKVIENIISPEEERKMLESIDWRGDENTQTGAQNQRNSDLPYFYPVSGYRNFACSLMCCLKTSCIFSLYFRNGSYIACDELVGQMIRINVLIDIYLNKIAASRNK